MCQDKVKHSLRAQSAFSAALCWAAAVPCWSEAEKMNQAEQATNRMRKSTHMSESHGGVRSPEGLHRQTTGYSVRGTYVHEGQRDPTWASPECGLSAAFVLRATGRRAERSGNKFRREASSHPETKGSKCFMLPSAFFIGFLKSPVGKKKKSRNLCCDAIHGPLEPCQRYISAISPLVIINDCSQIAD